MEPDANLPAARPLWSSHAWEEFQAVGLSQTYPPGVSLFEQGSPVRAVALIEEGLVKLLRWENHAEAVTVGIRVSGWSLGTAAAILGAPHAVTAETLTRCQILSISLDHFIQLVSTNGHVSSDLHHVHAHELLDYVTHLAGLGALSTTDRLLRLIGEIVTAEHRSSMVGSLRVALPLRYNELAGAIVTTRQHLARVLKQLEDDDLIRRQKGSLLIPDLERFWGRCQQATPAELIGLPRRLR
jgi:CRP-like cAMP-binding protein